MPDAPFGILQLVIIQIKQQTSVVIKHRSHLLNLHSIVLVENTKIPAVAVSIQNQSIQNAHPAEGIAAADALKVFQKNRKWFGPWSEQPPWQGPALHW